MDVLQSILSSRDQDGLGPVAELLACIPETRLDIIVSSVGGVGTNMLMEFLHRQNFSINLVTDCDTLKHPPRPPRIPQNRAPRLAVYLFGSPLLSVASHFRRGWAEAQAAKTSGAGAFQSFPASFEEYLERGQDLFGYENALRNWLDDVVEYDIMFVRYEYLFDNVEQILREACNRTGRSQHQLQTMVDQFPEKRARESGVSSAQQEMMYKDLQEKIERLPHVFIRRAGERVSLD